MMPIAPPRLGQNIHPASSPVGTSPAAAWAARYASPVPPSPFSLETGKDHDAGLFQDARTGFSHLLPGRPSLSPRPGDHPPADATVHLQDAPVTLRYKLEAPSVHASSAAELARITAERLASWRARSPVIVEPTNPTWLVAWGAEAAAVATYDVAMPPRTDVLREDLFVLVRQGMIYVVTWTYPRGFVEDPAYTSFASVAEATMIWDPLRWEQRGRIWPESSFVGPGIYAQPRPIHYELARSLARIVLPDDARARLLGVLSGVVSHAGAPWVELRPEVVDAHRRTILSTAHHPDLHAFVSAAFADVRTAHDLRALAVLLGRAFDERLPSSPP